MGRVVDVCRHGLLERKKKEKKAGRAEWEEVEEVKLREAAQIQNGLKRKRLAEALWFIAAAIGGVNVACPYHKHKWRQRIQSALLLAVNSFLGNWVCMLLVWYSDVYKDSE